MSPPLAGIRIIELGQMIAVPAATHILASYGAEVIKVENTGTGDELRFYGSGKSGMSGWFANTNSGKRSVALDLKGALGKDILWKLIATADALIEGFRPGVLDRLGFSYEAVRQNKPSIVYCSSSGFGPTGPYADLPVYDPLIQSLAGWAGAQAVDDKPTLVRGVVADKIAAWGNAQGLMAALIKSSRSGEGSYVQLSLLESSLAFVWPDVMMHCSLLDEDVNHQPNFLWNYRLYRCTDGWVSLAPSTDKQSKNLCEALGHPEVFERFDTAAKRGAALTDWFDATEKMVKNFAVEDLVDRLRAADVPVAAVLSPEKVATGAEVTAAGYIKESNHPLVGRILGPRPAADAFGEALELSPAPMQGEHSTEILSELGYSEKDISSLTTNRVVIQR